MASNSIVLRTCGLICCLFLPVFGSDAGSLEPWIMSFRTEYKQCGSATCKYLLNVKGGEFLGHLYWRLTPVAGVRGGACDVLVPNYELRELETHQWSTRLEVSVPYDSVKVYFCIHHAAAMDPGGQWVHQGAHLYLEPKLDGVSQKSLSDELDLQESQTSLDNEVQETEHKTTFAKTSNLEDKGNWTDLSHDIDVNYKPGAPRPTREEKKALEVLLNGRYVPYNSIETSRRKREILTPTMPSDFNNFKTDQGRKTTSPDEGLKHKRQAIDDFTTVRRVPSPLNGETTINDNATIDDATKDGNHPKDVKEVGAIKIEGIRIEDSEKEPDIIDGGIPSVLVGSAVTLRLFGEGLTARTVIAFTHDALSYGQPCKFLLKGEYMVKPDSLSSHSALFEITAPTPLAESKLYICSKNLRAGSSDPFNDNEKYLHQGTEPFTIFAVHHKLLPLWVTITLILTCLMFSALFSGLNLGLMSLDKTELKIIANTGTVQERKYARAIMPVRDHGNYLLCSILLGNVAVNSTFTILLDDLTSGLFAVIFSTLAIVMLGEITPQAICSRHGLMVGAKSIMVTKAVMAITAPLAYPVSKVLDYLLGEEIGSVFNRERLKELVKVTTGVNDLDRDEVNIISGALELRKKTVADVMTRLEDAFMLPITSVLDFATMSEIVKSGYSRIPVYEGQRGNIITVLFIKDLAFVDPDDNTPLRTLCQYYQNPCNFVFEDVTLDIIFRQFKGGHKGHMAFVHRINSEGEGDPFYETVGLLTLEDVIEEMIQAEILDETDVFLDNRTKRLRSKPQNKMLDFSAFAEKHENQRIHISPQLTLAAFQFLSSSVEAFRPDKVSETVLRRLLQQDVIQFIKLKGRTKKEAMVYHQGKAVDYFVLILEGRVEVTVGRESLVFEAGPFTYFGCQALQAAHRPSGTADSPTLSVNGSLQNLNFDSTLKHTFVPDYSVRAITELYYLTVKRSLYMAALRATLMEKGVLTKGQTTDQFDTEVDKLLQSVDEDLSVSGDHKTPSRQVSPNPLAPPVSASPHTRAAFTPPALAASPSPAPAAPSSPRSRDVTSGDEEEQLLH